MNKQYFFRWEQLLICFILSLIPNLAVNAKDDTPIGSDIIKSKRLRIYSTEDKTLSPEQILSLPEHFFLIPEEDIFTIKDTSKVYWVKVNVSAKDINTEQWVIEIMDSHVSQLDAYLYTSEKELEKIFSKSGYDYSFNNRLVEHKNFIIPLPPLQGKQEEVILLRYQTRLKNAVLLKLKETTSLLSYSNTEYILLGVFYGVLLILMIYNLIMYFFVKERFYLYYVLFDIACILVTLSEDALGFQYLWPNTPTFNYINAQYAPFLFMISLTLFSTSYLKMKQSSPLLWKLSWVGVGVNTIYLLLYVDMNNYLWSSPFYLLPTLPIAYFTLQQWWKKEPMANFFLIGFLSTIMGIIVVSLRSRGLYLTSSIWGVYSFNFGVLFNLLFLSMALAENYKILKVTKEKAQQKLIEELKVREQVIEQKVVERTNEIAKQQSIIAEKNKELSAAYATLEQQAAEIENINRQLQSENEELHENLEGLSTARVMMKELSFQEFQATFPDEDTCYNFLENLKWGKGFSCKKCGADTYTEIKEKHTRRCTKCSYSESVTAKTLFHRLHFPLEKAFHIVFLVFVSRGEMSSTRISEILGIRQATCWRFSKRVKERMEGATKELGGEDKLREAGWDYLLLE
ncbi:7TM diverse intracellular signaling domain-containing protein [Algivirga pacifica]|uniref:7TMR-DISM extracellular 2 n=1 Tax=Algivirga pacifica TaxID=1162670 RepID=A0ABP9DMU9_9BACT